jgi:hypothetical protein
MRPSCRLALALLLFSLGGSVLPKQPPNGRWITVFGARQELALRNRRVSVWGRDGEFVVGGADDAALSGLADEGVVPLVKVPDEGQWIYFFFHSEDAAGRPAAPPQATVQFLSPTTDLWLFPGQSHGALPRVRKPAGTFFAVARTELAPIAPHPADLLAPAAPTVVNPLVQQIVDATDQATWFQDVRDLSGENTVTIGGQTFTISTRYSDAMFPLPQANAHATEYLLDRGSGWGYTGVRESYTSANSGCGLQTRAWQNVVFTLPGQVDFGQHQQVLFVTHYDSLSFSTQESLTYAPGADDAISGGSALLEALRTFRNYGFRNTVKVIFFSGEEQGICGSGAYVRQHPASDMWRAVNMDQTAFDGNANRLMDVYNWNALNSPSSMALGDAFVQANGDYGNIIDPAKIVRDTSKMCQTDHCPFWNVGVGAIAVTEDLHNNDICPCFDQFQSSTCHDTVTQLWNGQLMFTPDYSWPSQKAAVALVAALADPLYACPVAAPDPVATAENHAVRLDWPAAPGVTHYVVERAFGCAGAFTAVASVPGTSYEDVSLVNGLGYGYRLRTCPNQVSACIVATPQAGASVVLQPGSAQVVSDGGDHDGVTDDCELVTVSLNLLNDGSVPLTGVRLAAVTSDDPAVQVASALPQNAGSLAVGATAPASFKFYLGRSGSSAVCGETLPFHVTASANEAPASVRSFDLSAERTSQAGPLVYGFETDLSGWTVTSGSFTRVAGGAPGSTGSSLHSRSPQQNNDCNAVVSPLIRPSQGSTLTLWVNYGIEAGNFDRAVVRAVDPSTGIKTLLVPNSNSAALYDTTGNTNLLCDNLGNLRGWSGSHATWRGVFVDLSPFVGTPIQIEVRYSTDASALGSQGFWLDLVQISNAVQVDCDGQSDVCAPLPAEVSPAGAPVPFTLGKSGTDLLLSFSESAGASQYHVYAGTLDALHQGFYDHGAVAGLCGFTDAAPGDGQVVAPVPAAALPDAAYLLAVARNAAGESSYGADGSGDPIPLALSACP